MRISASSRRGPLMAIGLLIFVAVAAYEVSQYILEGDTTALIYIAMMFVGGVIVIAILNDWKKGVYLFLTWLLFEDFARKFLGNNMAIYFAKDFLVLIVYLAFFVAYRRKEVTTFKPPFRVPLLLMVWLGVMQIFNPASTHIVYGLLGMKLFFYYVPLMFVGYALFNSEADLRRFFTYNSVLILIIASLGVAQAILGHTFMNPEHPAEDIRELSTLYRTAPISGITVYRPTSVFVSDGRYANFLLVSWLLLLGFTGYLLLRHRKGRAIAFVCLAVVCGAVVLGASRQVLLWSMASLVVSGIAFVWGAPWKQREVVRVLRTLQRSALGVALAMILLFFLFPDALMSRVAFYSETLLPSSSANELLFRSRDYPLQNFLGAFSYDRWPYGYGIGTTSLGTQYVARIFGAKPLGVGVESGYGALVVEQGILGLIFWIITTCAIVVSGWKVVNKLRGSPWFPLAFMIFWYSVLLLFPMTVNGIQPYEDFVMNAYLWLLLGILFRLPTLAASAQFAAVRTTPVTLSRWTR